MGVHYRYSDRAHECGIYGRMKTIAVISQKGGAGKTTLSINLAVASELAGEEAIVLDVDPQGSAQVWGRIRESGAPVVVPARAADLADVLAKARGAGAGLAVIDTAPRCGHAGAGGGPSGGSGDRAVPAVDFRP